MTVICHLNAGTLWSLSEHSAVPKAGDDIDYSAVKDAGFVSLQHHWPEPAALAAGLGFAGMLRITDPDTVDAMIANQVAWGSQHTSIHLGTGFETADQAKRLIDAMFEAGERHNLCWSVETHRATLTQDIHRTLTIIDHYPKLRFTADLSHWYTGLEMTYGDLDWKFDLLDPVFKRVRYIHLRVGHSCQMQLPLFMARKHPCWHHFSDLWTRCFKAALPELAEGENLIIAPELLPARVFDGAQDHVLNYAALDGHGNELSDRWQDAMELTAHVKDLAKVVAPPSS